MNNIQEDWDNATPVDLQSEWDNATPTRRPVPTLDAKVSYQPEQQGLIPDIQKAWSNFTTNISSPPPSDIRRISPIAGGFLNAAGRTIGLGIDVAIAGLRSAYKSLPSAMKFSETPIPIEKDYIQQGINDYVVPAMQAGSEFVKKYIPEGTRNDIENVLNIASVIPAKAVTMPMAKSASKVAKETGAILDDTTNLFSRTIQPVTEDVVDKEINNVVRNNINKSIKATTKGKETLPLINRYFENAGTGIKEIINNKNNLNMTNSVGEVVNGVLPETRMQMAEAIHATETKLFKEYDAMKVAAGEKGSMLDLTPIANELDNVIKDEALFRHPDGLKIQAYAKELQELLLANKAQMTPDAAQNWIANANATLQNKNLNALQFKQAGVDAGVASMMRKHLDNLIESTEGAGYQNIKNRYGAVKSLREGTNKAAFASMAEKNMPNFFDITSGAGLVHALLMANPKAAVTMSFLEGLNWFRRYMRSPDTYVKRMFSDVDNLMAKKGAFELQSKTGQYIQGLKPDIAYDTTRNISYPPIKQIEYNPILQRVNETPMLNAEGAKKITFDNRGVPVGEPYSPEVIDAMFKSTARDIRPLDIPRRDPTLALPSGQGFTLREAKNINKSEPPITNIPSSETVMKPPEMTLRKIKNATKKVESTRLKNRWELKDEISKLDINDDLRKQIEIFMDKNESSFPRHPGDPSRTMPGNVGGLIYRGNLHYIIDNINKPGLIDELIKYNKN